MTNAFKLPGPGQQAFVLHAYPYRETSLIVEILSREHGRLAVVARGAKRPRSALRGLLLPFQPLILNWFGKSELRTLRSAEWQGGQPPLSGTALICGFYLNELMLRLTARDDPHISLFDCYQASLKELAATQNYSAILRRFEKEMLQQLGYAIPLDIEIDSGNAISQDKSYYYVVERGPTLQESRNAVMVSGQSLLDLSVGHFTNAISLRECKILLRSVINHYLGDATIHTRQILKDLQQR